MENHRGRILIVDDEKDLVDVMANDLKQQGYFVDAAYDGIEGLSKVESGKPDLIISDINMPRMNGLEFLISIQERNLRIPVIILTAFGDYDAIRIAWKFGAFDFIEKPIDRQTLNEIVQTSLVLGKDHQNASQSSRFGKSIYRKIELKLDEKQFHTARELAESRGLSINSLFMNLVENEYSSVIEKVS